MTTNHAHIDPAHSRLHMRIWAAVVALAVAVFTVSLIVLFAANATQDAKIKTAEAQTTAQGEVIDRQNGVIGQVCRVAGGQVNSDPAAKSYCERVESGLPAVPPPPLATVADGVGVRFTRQVDRCYVEIGLTSGVVNRMGPFCGRDGSVGPTGPTGPTGPGGPSGAAGQSGQPGASGLAGPSGQNGQTGAKGEPGTGIQDVRTSTNRCYVDVILTDGTSRTLGPFCGPPMGEFTVSDSDGSSKHCIRDGGSDEAPNYTCSQVAPATTTTTTPPLVPVPSAR